MDQIDDEDCLARKKPGRKIAGSPDCTGSSTTELDKSLCPAVAEPKSFVVGAWQMLKIDLEDSQIPWSMQECYFHLRSQSLGETIVYFCCKFLF